MTSMMTSETTAFDIDRAVDVIALAFSADPICRWAYPDPHVYYEYFPAFVCAFAGRAFETGTAYVADDYAGAALWLPPGVHPDEETLTLIIDQSIPADLRGPLFDMIEQQEAAHPTEPHWYLPMIGVDPVHQGKGHGSRLLARSLEVCDREGLPAYLEATSTGSRALYERHGFEVVSEIQVADSPPMWPMLRRPR